MAHIKNKNKKKSQFLQVLKHLTPSGIKEQPKSPLTPSWKEGHLQLYKLLPEAKLLT